MFVYKIATLSPFSIEEIKTSQNTDECQEIDGRYNSACVVWSILQRYLVWPWKELLNFVKRLYILNTYLRCITRYHG